ncbi:DUF3768 domain-containing protein [Microvirga sp. HBU67558]|uniref:DUF3768 domain-containing protein n=1 Tax=Microvirga TaxID=186650 RepID=UPI001B398B8D|nr:MULTISPECIES: DUF3768 domain-containing protein [unclassified Microvirga]MBQ0820606.1 DUF3768 domain-containing protein [Microvirga sp. HBU67558]
MAHSIGQTAARVCDLNDQLRKHRIGGRVVMTRGIAALGNEMVLRIDQAVRGFNAFSPDNDPYGEHDFGAVRVEEHMVMFKIDYYDLDLQYASPDPTDPNVTCRVMTLMLANEY